MKTTALSLAQLSQNLGIVLMTAAATFGILELPEHPNGRAVLSNQPAFAFASELSQEGSNPIRREKEESAPHYVSYNVSQRTPGRTGRI